MTLKNIVLTAALALGVSACNGQDNETPWGEVISKQSYSSEGYVVHVAEFEKATLVYDRLDNEIPICNAAVIPDYAPQDISSVSAATIVHNPSIPGQVLINPGCDPQVETHIENVPSGSQIIRPRDQWEQLFKEEYDPLFKEIKEHFQL